MREIREGRHACVDLDGSPRSKSSRDMKTSQDSELVVTNTPSRSMHNSFPVRLLRQQEQDYYKWVADLVSKSYRYEMNHQMRFEFGSLLATTDRPLYS